MTLAEYRQQQQEKADKDEARFLLIAIRKAGGVVARAARDLEVSEAYLQRRIGDLKLRLQLAVIRKRAGYVPKNIPK